MVSLETARAREKETKLLAKQTGGRLRTVYCAACPESGSWAGGGWGAQGEAPPSAAICPRQGEAQSELTAPAKVT